MNKKIMILAVIFIVAIMLTGCDKKTDEKSNKKNGSISWPTDISYVPNIKYEGKGYIVNTKEDTDYGNQYMIYIKGSDLASANQYVDKLYSSGYTVMNMFSASGKYLEQPKTNKSYKMGYENEDGSISVQVILHDGRDDYNMVITWADTSD